MRLKIVVLFISMSFFLKCQTRNKSLGYGLINQIFLEKNTSYKLNTNLIPFLNGYFENKDVFNFNFLNKLTPANLNNYQSDIVESILKKQDLEFMKSQLKKVDVKTLDTKKLTINKNYISVKNYVKTGTDNIIPNDSTYHISWPIFSEDSKVAMIYIENYCGIDCGGGQLSIYEKDKNGVWKFVGAIGTFIS